MTATQHRISRLVPRKRTRTPTVLPPLGPEPSASTNSATSARRARILTRKRRFVNDAVSTNEEPTRKRSTARAKPRARRRPRTARDRAILTRARAPALRGPAAEPRVHPRHAARSRACRCAEDELAELLDIAAGRARRIRAPARRDGARRRRSCATAATRSASSPSSTSCAGACRAIPTASASSCATTAAHDLFLARARCTRCCTATASWRAIAASTARPAAKARSSKCSSARQQQRRRPAAATSTASLVVVPRTSASARTS